jgi:microcin C transport system substrate-binding protein
MQDYDFDIASRALGSVPTPGDSLREVYGSEAGKSSGSANIAGIDHPAVDALVQRIGQAATREELETACRALDRVLRAGHYWIPMWFKPAAWLAYWDMYDRPATRPRFGTGAPGTWWYDADKAKRIGRA